MGIVTSWAVGHATSCLVDTLVEQFRSRILDRCVKDRFENFFDTLCEEIRTNDKGSMSDVLLPLLEPIENDVAIREMLFDAFRRVSLSKSRVLGPRIIAVIIATLYVENRHASEFEDRMMSAAESLSDLELHSFVEFINEQLLIANDKPDGKVSLTENGELKVKCDTEKFDSNFLPQDKVSVVPLSLDAYLGRWASKLESFGILCHDMRERSYQYSGDCETHFACEGTVREITWWVCVPSDSLKFSELIARVSNKASF